MTSDAQQDESDCNSDSDFDLISDLEQYPNSTSSPPTSTSSPVEMDRDYNLLHHLWIGIYPVSEIGRTGLNLTSYPRYLLKRHISFDETEPEPEPEPHDVPGPRSVRDDPSRQMVFCIDELVHDGQLWDIYRGELMGCDGISKPQSLILKLMRPSAFPNEYPPGPEDPRGED
ncbi:hypothetical protein I302_102669 [Kwoniella bestiolae CBS 10118]|uniref:Uncharacterized protein n=1 Tax=Kwoniella bestiolae CBS 10118 TaxID=1296100 RepID=A0A1B9GFM6_9TREE|nr:hypothetical protein I302_01363 [Kwoniella bestiolae CBS 10118]OCF29850.1 hypothetical protein I302_01363 [Kwoniella bestiolae CBS 10118]